MSAHRPVGPLEAAYVEQLALCEDLEAVADTLPHPFDPARLADIAHRTEAVLERLQTAERTELFPLLLLRGDRGAVERREKAHNADAAAAAEVAEALSAQLRGTVHLSPDAQGYLLRSYFEGIRRHIEAEAEWLRLFAQHRKV